MGNQLALTNVVDISVSQSNLGVGTYNTSNLAIFTDEIPANSFGTLGYAAYVEPTTVATDFGSSSKTAQMANAVFSQQPNILAGNGQLIVILMTVATQHLAFSGTAASGVFVFNYGGHASASINWSDTASAIQVKLRAMPNLENVLVTGSIATSLNVQFAGVYGVLSLATITGDTLQTGGSSPITITVTTATAGETIGAAITRAASLVQFFGITATSILAEVGQTDLLAAAAVVQALNKIAFFVSNVSADIAPGGMLDLLTTGSFTKTRGLYYGYSDSNDSYGTAVIACLEFLAAYSGRALSTNFTGSNTTQTMHLKTLAGVAVDPTITQTLLNEAVAAGADTYISLQGDPSVFTSGENGGFFDQIYNLQWYVGALQVAVFNYLASAGTKVPQTESGMDGLKGVCRGVSQQAVTNQYFAPGSWNSATTFGNPADLIANVAQVGYYIYSSPIALQAQATRVARQAPLIQIAGKEAGAIQQSSIIVNVNP